MNRPDPAAERCCLCNVRIAETDEHVPPRSWFERPYPDNLITVRACEECNHGSHLDDDYLLTFLCAMQIEGGTPTLDRARERMIRGLQRPQAERFRARLESNSEVTVRVDERTGERVISAVAMRPEPDRVMKTIRKQTRALVYHLTGRILSQATFTMLERVWGLQTRPAQHWELFTQASEYALRNGRRDALGNVFRYHYCEIQRSACIAVLRLEYYGVFPYVVLIFLPDFAPPQRVRFPF
jgi:hypothetical protein